MLLSPLVGSGAICPTSSELINIEAAALNMTEPGSTGIGGDIFCLYWDAKQKKVHALNGSGRSPKNTTLDQVRKQLGIPAEKNSQIPLLSALAATVPGAPAGWVDAIEKFGSGRLTMEQILMPAIELGEQGFPVSELSASFVGCLLVFDWYTWLMEHSGKKPKAL